MEQDSRSTLSVGSSTDIQELLSPVVSEPHSNDIETAPTPLDSAIDPILLSSLSQIKLPKYHDNNTEGVVEEVAEPFIFNPNGPSHRRASFTESVTNSLLELRDITWKEIKRDRFIIIGVFSIICLFVFQLVFLPRSSLDRDLRRLHGEHITFDECSRIFLSFLNSNVNETTIEYDMEQYLQSNRSIGQSNMFINERFQEMIGMKTEIQYFDIGVKSPKNVKVIFNGTFELNNVQVAPFSAGVKNLKAPLVYANYGEENDYNNLIANDKTIDLKNVIILVRLNENIVNVSTTIELAQNKGILGIIFYNDQRDDGKFTMGNGFKAYPNGFGRNPDSIIGISALLSNGSIPIIPVLSLDENEANIILESIGMDIELNIEMETNIETMGNVISTIPGIIYDEEIIISVEMDTFNGKGGGSNGITTLLQLIKGFNELTLLNWKPLKTIKFICWDGSTIGGKFSIDAYLKNENNKKNEILTVIHLNGVKGSQLLINANPLLNEMLFDTSMKVEMNSTFTSSFNKSSFYGDEFQKEYGIPSFSIGYENDKNKDPVPYWGDDLDGISWVKLFDPKLESHNKLAQFVGKFVLDLSENELLGFRLEEYYELMDKFLRELGEVPKQYKELKDEIEGLIKEGMGKSRRFDLMLKKLDKDVTKDFPWYLMREKMRIAKKVKSVNSILKSIDKIFVSGKGGHLIFGTNSVFNEISKGKFEEFGIKLNELKYSLKSISAKLFSSI